MPGLRSTSHGRHAGRHSALHPTVALVAALAAAGVFSSAGARLAASGQRPSPRDVARACETALVTRTFEEAKAAGLNPSAIPVSFDAATSTVTARNGRAVVTGVAAYRPTPHVDAFQIHFECDADPETAAVSSVTYHALDASGAPRAKRPVALVADGIVLEACRWKLYERVAGRAVDDGLPTNGVEVALDVDSASSTTNGGRLEVRGQGRVRESAGDDWQPVTFECRYDVRKATADRASYRGDRAAAPMVDPARTAAQQTCARAIDDEVIREARARGYRSIWRVQVNLNDRATFADTPDGLRVGGSGAFKLDPRHAQPTPLTYTCVVAPTGAVVSASFVAGSANWTASGDIATGPTATLVCESLFNVQKRCSAPIKGDVRVVRELRGSRGCVANRTWIWSLEGITVLDGCRAEFEYTVR